MGPRADSLAPPEWLSIAGRGLCNICGERRSFALPADSSEIEDIASLREALMCRTCGAISRERCLMVGLAGVLNERAPLSGWTPRGNVRVFETSGYRGHPRYLATLFDYFNLPYAPPPDDNSTDAVDGRSGADLQDLQFPDGFFDVVLSAEVLEHVVDEQLAIREIARVLSPGGHLVLQAPYWHPFERNYVRVNRWHGRDVYLYPPEYHADETLVYRIYGRELLEDLAAAGFAVAHLQPDLPQLGVSRQTLIIARKGGYVDLGGFRVDTWLV
jgi:SAM-dependent methyltransferase